MEINVTDEELKNFAVEVKESFINRIGKENTALYGTDPIKLGHVILDFEKKKTLDPNSLDCFGYQRGLYFEQYDFEEPQKIVINFIKGETKQKDSLKVIVTRKDGKIEEFTFLRQE